MFDCELLAAHAAIRHFRHFFEGRAFQLWKDHKLLVTALSHVSAPILPLQQRHLAFISEFNVQMLYLPGLKNVIADFLSCPPPPRPSCCTGVIWNCRCHDSGRSSGSLLISTVTWWALYSTVVVATTFSRSLITHPNGWKQFPFLRHPQRRVHVL